MRNSSLAYLCSSWQRWFPGARELSSPSFMGARPRVHRAAPGWTNGSAVRFLNRSMKARPAVRLETAALPTSKWIGTCYSPCPGPLPEASSQHPSSLQASSLCLPSESHQGPCQEAVLGEPPGHLITHSSPASQIIPKSTDSLNKTSSSAECVLHRNMYIIPVLHFALQTSSDTPVPSAFRTQSKVLRDCPLPVSLSFLALKPTPLHKHMPSAPIVWNDFISHCSLLSCFHPVYMLSHPPRMPFPSL